MNSMKVKLTVLVLVMGVVAACASPATEAPASQPTEAAASMTEAPTEAPAATEASATEAPTTEAAASGATISFAADVLPLLESRCVSCHGGNRTSEGLDLKSHASLMTGSESGAVIVPGNADSSLLIDLVAEGEMPKRGPKLTPEQVQLISDWVNQGALDN